MRMGIGNYAGIAMGVASIVAAAVVSPAAQAVTTRTPDEVVASVLPARGVRMSPAPATKTTVPRHELCHTSIPRAGTDRPDTRDGRLIHVVYLLGAGAPDDALDMSGTLDCSLLAQNEWMEEQTGGLRWRFDTFHARVRDAATGKVARAEVADVTFLRSALPMIELSNASAVEAELLKAGLDDPEKRYLTYVAGGAEGGGCGDALMPLLVLPGAEAADGQYAQVYLFADDACRAMEFGVPGKPSFSEAIAQQEIVHNDGVVSAGAPHACPLGVPPGVGHVCTGLLAATEGRLNLDPERVDLMYPYVSVPLSEKVLDAGRDDYFNPSLPHLVDLAGSPYLEVAK